MEPVKWGILSTANINRRVMPGAQASSQVELLAVGSRDGERARAFAETWRIPRAYGSYDELLADPDVEAVYIPLPNTLHVEWSIKAMDAGKHVLCEKPLSQHSDDVTAAFDASERTGMLLTEAFMYRHHPQAAKVRELIDDGAIGELRLIRSTFSYSLYDESNIRLRTDVEGGALMDVGCYCVHASRFVAGAEPVEVRGQAWFGPTGTDWVFTGQLRFPGDVLALFDCGTALVNRDELEIVGSEGSLFLDDPWHCTNAAIEVRGDQTSVIDFEPVDPYRLELEDVSAAIRGDGGLLLGRDDALGQARTIEALLDDARRR